MSESGVRNSWLTLLKNDGLRPIELREPFGAHPLRFVGAGVHECGANLVGDEPQERRGIGRPAGGAD